MHHLMNTEDSTPYITIGFVVLSIIIGLIAIILGGLAITGTINFGSITSSADITSKKNIIAEGTIVSNTGFDVGNSNFTVEKDGDTAIAGYLAVKGPTGIDNDFDVNTDKFTVASATGNTAIAGTLDVTGKFGYTSGGTKTQVTSKSTGVTLNNLTGQITMNGAALGANTSVSFVVTNSTVAANDIIILNHLSVGLGSYLFSANTITNGSFTITASNITANPLSQAVVISFIVIKGAIA
tara:strand:+ start:246 stop:962 length:717 start_codon:yes stop_codon:yes gene_type:complete